MKTLVFDFRADWGHFRKFFTTSSPLTFSIMPPTAVYGLLGAVIGLSKKDNRYLQYLNYQTVQLAIQLKRPIKKVRWGMNLINTKGNIWVPKYRREGAHTQIRTEFLKDPDYRLYIHVEDDHLFQQLIYHIRHHRSVYTPCMGLSECIGDFTFVRVDEFEEVTDDKKVEVLTAIPLYLLKKGLDIQAGKNYFKETLPFDMKPDREVTQYEEVLFEANGLPINGSLKRYWQNNKREVITFL